MEVEFRQSCCCLILYWSFRGIRNLHHHSHYLAFSIGICKLFSSTHHSTPINCIIRQGLHCMISYVKGQVHQHPLYPIQRHTAVILGTAQPTFEGILRKFLSRQSRNLAQPIFCSDFTVFGKNLTGFNKAVSSLGCFSKIPQMVFFCCRESLGWDLDPRPLPYQGNALPG